MNKKKAKRILELMYLYAWGPQGTCELRDEWHQYYILFKKEYDIGEFSYDGNSSCTKWGVGNVT